jgi:uncharacterized repeat protein (TIGR04138 family)
MLLRLIRNNAVSPPSQGGGVKGKNGEDQSSQDMRNPGWALMVPNPVGEVLFDKPGWIGQAWGMQPMQYEQSVFSILKRDKRFDAQAYLFLKEALDFTLKRVAEGNGGRVRHVSGPELLEGFRDLALEQFGPMASTLMIEWGIRKCQDVGDMVFLLIEEQVFGKQDSDSREDFSGSFDLEDALAAPFLPIGKQLVVVRNGEISRSRS